MSKHYGKTSVLMYENQLKVESEDRDRQIQNLGGSKWVSILLGRRKEFMVNKTKVSGGLEFLFFKKKKKLQQLRNSLESDVR